MKLPQFVSVGDTICRFEVVEGVRVKVGVTDSACTVDIGFLVGVTDGIILVGLVVSDRVSVAMRGRGVELAKGTSRDGVAKASTDEDLQLTKVKLTQIITTKR
jgi:hypothetical protein